MEYPILNEEEVLKYLDSKGAIRMWGASPEVIGRHFGKTAAQVIPFLSKMFKGGKLNKLTIQGVRYQKPS